MRDFKRFLAWPTLLPLSLPVITMVLVVVVFVMAAQHLHAAGGEHFPVFNALAGMVLIMLLGAATAVRSFQWMRREYPDRMHELDLACRTALRQANGGFSKWLAARRHSPVPRVVVILGWVAVGVLAAGVAMFATGVL